MQGNLNDLLKDLPPELARATARYGVRLAIDLLETFYSDLAGERAPEKAARKKRGRPAKELLLPEVKVTRREAGKSGWPDDPEERSREMKRRQAVARAKLVAEATHEKQSSGAKKRWNNMSPAQKQAWMRNMQRGKKRAAKNAKTDVEVAA